MADMDRLYLNREQCRRYLDRISVHQDVKVDLDSLKLIMCQHRSSVIFENLDTYFSGRPAVLELENIFQKIVLGKRGGYCFELSIAFAGLLNGLGFHASLCGCKLRSMEQHVNHGAVIVRLEDNIYYCDVGLGCDIPAEPVRLIPGSWISPRGFSCSVKEINSFWWKYSFSPGIDIYICKDEYCIDDYRPLNHYMTMNPGKFRDSVILFRNTHTGYVFLSDHRFRQKMGNELIQSDVAEAEREELVKREFGISFSEIQELTHESIHCNMIGIV